MISVTFKLLCEASDAQDGIPSLLVHRDGYWLWKHWFLWGFRWSKMMYLCSARWRICKALPWSSVQQLRKTLAYPLLSKPTYTLCCCHGELLQLLKPLGLLPYQPIYKRPKKGKNTHTTN
jgi:hypothetical protein